MGNGFMQKGLAALGKGMATAGEIGLKANLQTERDAMTAKLLAKRDEKLQFYLDRRSQEDNVSRERIAGAGNVARRDLKLEERGWQQQDAEAKRLADTEELASEQDFDLKKLDYEHKLKKDLEGFKAKHGTTTTSSLIQNINFLVEKEIATTPRTAFEMLRQSVEKPEHEAVLDLAAKLRTGTGYFGKDGVDRSMQDAKRMVKSVKGPSATPKPGAAAPATGGQDYTDEDLQFTAKKHGLTIDEVKRRLGGR